jgi:hypothetical protein
MHELSVLVLLPYRACRAYIAYRNMTVQSKTPPAMYRGACTEIS